MKMLKKAALLALEHINVLKHERIIEMNTRRYIDADKMFVTYVNADDFAFRKNKPVFWEELHNELQLPKADKETTDNILSQPEFWLGYQQAIIDVMDFLEDQMNNHSIELPKIQFNWRRSDEQ